MYEEIATAFINIRYETNDGVEHEATFRSHSIGNLITTLAKAHRETARMLSVLGAEAHAREVTEEAITEVVEWRVTRTQNPEAA